MDSTELTGTLRTHLRAACPKAAVAVQAVMSDLPAPFPEEAAQLSPNAVPKRRAQFRAGRHAAHKAMREIGIAPTAILRGPQGMPIWPDGLVGTISHTDEIAIALVAEQRNVAGLGVDLERADRFTPQLAKVVLTDAETDAGVDVGAAFTAKEAIYKALFPQLRKVVGFQDVEISLDLANGRFIAKPLYTLSPSFKAGQTFASGQVWRVDEVILAVAELDMKYGR